MALSSNPSILRSLGIGNADEAQVNVVAGVDCAVEECQLLARRIREDGFEDEAFTLSDEFAPKSAGNLCGLVGRYVQFARDVVGVDEAQSRLTLAQKTDDPLCIAGDVLGERNRC
jgi:hypothetical protein